MYENDFFYAETPVPDVKFHVWNIQIHTSIQQSHILKLIRAKAAVILSPEDYRSKKPQNYREHRD